MDLALFLCLVVAIVIAADLINDNEFQHKLDKLEE